MSLDGRNYGGLGDILAGGVRRAAEKIGGGAGYATSPAGADHMHNMRGPVVDIDSQASPKYYVVRP